MNNKMVMDIVEMTNTITKIDNTIQKLENAYKELNDRMKDINDSSEIWNGESQSAAYKRYVTIANDFPNSIDQMKALRNFLENALNSYIVGDSVLDKSINNNEAGLDVE